jgi:septum formation topological specificity factor MinE
MPSAPLLLQTFSARKKKTAQDRHKSLDSEAGKMSKLQHKVADKVADYIDESEDDMEVDLVSEGGVGCDS